MGELPHAQKKDALTVTLALAGTALAWFPILAPIAFALVAFITRGRFLFDYLMPAELFFLVFAAINVLAQVTGLASGATEPTGWPWLLVMASLVVYWLAVITIGVGGLLLLRDRFKVLKPT